ncbi:hypothetical protein [Archangium sp.]|uniref:hypothetical protein n=1 Tax=Archangium sp. TaxID=1872627 RepID=UPI002D544515|nr:hypothetical protein [Archangium sp.]HYO52320.1 hypothetical protein [Archangium sp.]
MRKILPILLALLCSCNIELPPLEDFRILAITPSEQFTTEPKIVTVWLDTDPRFLVNYGDQSVEIIDEPILEIGSQTVPLGTYLGHGQFQGIVWSGLEVGRYEIRVKLGDGREATLPDAYEVKPSVGFWIESIGDQLEGQPFTITIHAAGPGAEHFEGSAEVILYKDGQEFLPLRGGTFSAGVCRERLVIDTAGHYLVMVRDDQGNSATSNSFRVISKN